MLQLFGFRINDKSRYVLSFDSENILLYITVGIPYVRITVSSAQELARERAPANAMRVVWRK